MEALPFLTFLLIFVYNYLTFKPTKKSSQDAYSRNITIFRHFQIITFIGGTIHRPKLQHLTLYIFNRTTLSN